MISHMEKKKPCYALQIANQSRGSCSEYSAPLEMLYVVTGTIVYQYNEALDYDDKEDLEEKDEVALDDLNEEDDKVSLNEA